MAVIHGTIGVDTINGTSVKDRIWGGLGNDFLSGLDGNDWLGGGLGQDHLVGGLGDDELVGGRGADLLEGGDGNDTLFGSGTTSGSLNDDKDGDFLDGGSGDDIVYVGAGDTALGGIGYDTLTMYENIDLHDVLYNLDFTNINSATAKSVGVNDQNYSTTMVGQFESVEINIYNALEGSQVRGSKWDDYLSVSLENLSSQPQLSGVILFGGAGDDTIRGSEKNDRISGGDGNDIISTSFSGGVDTLSGGLGSDIFEFQYFTGFQNTILVDGPERITDFSSVFDFFTFEFVGGGLDFGTQSNLLFTSTNPTNATTVAGIAQFLYDTDGGQLSLDTNGRAAGGVVLLATLLNKAAITADNIVLDF